MDRCKTKNCYVRRTVNLNPTVLPYLLLSTESLKLPDRAQNQHYPAPIGMNKSWCKAFYTANLTRINIVCQKIVFGVNIFSLSGEKSFDMP